MNIVGGEARRKVTTRNIRRKWVDNIKIDLKEIGCDGVDRVNLAQDTDHWRAL
jgi:hypothetical protein